jgi:hypothetical protein
MYFLLGFSIGKQMVASKLKQISFCHFHLFSTKDKTTPYNERNEHYFRSLQYLHGEL